MTTQVATQGANGAGSQVTTLDDLPLNRAIAQMEDKFKAALPAHIPSQRFVRTAINAIMKPEIERVAKTAGGRQSIYESCLKAAADGLLLDGREGALVSFRANVGDYDNPVWEERAQYMPMIAGVLKKVRNSGEIDTIYCNPVYRNDTFKLSMVADGVPVTHEPAQDDRGDFVGVYAVARLKNGSWTQPEWMTRSQVDAVRERSKSGAMKDNKGKDRRPNGPWVTDYTEMARKTVLRRASKLWPSSTDKDGVDVIARAFENDTDTAFDTIELTPATPAQPRKQPTAARMLAQETQPQGQQPAQTGGGDGGGDNPPDDFPDV